MGIGAALVVATLAAAPQAHCLKALAPLAADSVPVSGNFEPADCAAGKAAPAFRYDQAIRSTRLARAIAPGEIVPVYPEFGIDMVRPGQMLQLVVTSGAARIVREVQAMQPARQGQRLFVKSADGQILSVRYEGGAP